MVTFTNAFDGTPESRPLPDPDHEPGPDPMIKVTRPRRRGWLRA